MKVLRWLIRGTLLACLIGFIVFSVVLLLFGTYMMVGQNLPVTVLVLWVTFCFVSYFMDAAMSSGRNRHKLPTQLESLSRLSEKNRRLS